MAKMKNKWSRIFYWFLAVFPFILSAAFYSRLPEQVAVHWDSADVPNGYASRPVAAFGVPALLLAVTLLVNFSFSVDPKKQNIDRSPQLKAISRWSIVILANLAQGMTILKAVGVNVKISAAVTVAVGILITAIGNYLPKCKYNYTMGIRLPWTLASEENWRKTHRFAGFLWIIGGIVIIVTAFLPAAWLLICAIILLAAVPAGYSYSIYRRDNSKSR